MHLLISFICMYIHIFKLCCIVIFFLLQSEKLFRQALKVAEVNYRKSQQFQHQGPLQESLHSNNFVTLFLVYQYFFKSSKYSNNTFIFFNAFTYLLYMQKVLKNYGFFFFSFLKEF